MAARRGKTGPRIFISYRRDDASAHAGRLSETLSSEVRGAEIFIDVDSIDPGADFVHRINEAVGQCNVLIAVIGPNWQHAANADGSPRLADPNDYVRLEIEAAMVRGVPIVPALVNHATVLTATDLPESLAPLLRREAIELRDVSWRSDVSRLARGIAPEDPPKQGRKALLAGFGIAAAVVLAVVLYLVLKPNPSMSAADKSLLAQSPGTLVSSQCAHDAAASKTSGSLAAVTCHRGASAVTTSPDQFDTLTVQQFNSDSALAQAFNNQVKSTNAASFSKIGGDCADRPTATHNYTSKDSYGGGALCYQSQGKSYLWFTIFPKRILEEAERNDTDASTLYGWWDQLVNRDMATKAQVQELKSHVPQAYQPTCLFDNTYFDDTAGDRAVGVDCARSGDAYDLAYFEFLTPDAMSSAYKAVQSSGAVATGTGQQRSCPMESTWHRGQDSTVLGRVLCVPRNSGDSMWFTTDATNIMTFLGRFDNNASALYDTWISVLPQ
jgi:hypothetical protein